MKHFFTQLPIPFGGVALAIATLGSFFSFEHLAFLGTAVTIISVILLLLLILKLVITPRSVIRELGSPIIMSVAPTIPMTIMILITNFSNYPIAKLIWLLALALHVGFIFTLSGQIIKSHLFSRQRISPSWFVTYVGIGVGAITCRPFNSIIGKNCFWVALICYVVLLPMILNRIYRSGNIPSAMLPLITILAAPGSLCLDGYLHAFSHPQLPMIIALLVISQIFYLLTIITIHGMISLPFASSFAGFTFPLVISASALANARPYLSLGMIYSITYQILVIIESTIAVAVVIYVLVRFVVQMKVAMSHDLSE
ncbi:TDT family transporter [Paucilactobacillus suebicus]|uniref:Exfoliative toxin A n=1 Tax=Paucilactobacillus suebicus DSM 5007 = KCTC 3549 TaxID=1423807 RepID=A0A0R1VUJ0_9LACO|nr:TDT family transporter [Paucilactobacillus suebicus]KRM09440.1 exfoliative toxin A [Paucilactobacillus suebicus DSM 5007 = KCTC 3549]